ncbi:protein serine/threonine phosphatase [Acidithiobacillus ferrivorans SS3]|uniref:Protein serine/threonine phosphatase n=1 Tax=Acidithiobacillus ferrivorans SS3 TaxID=743299 RepID=G0JLT4_9PROT|nr:PP2C family serine/threonine-protein phosphatase [Acidithiobacillus ferrivorans]AEM49246.1 protein serine/threonine phosphatase [Acidithiobacillus ferrivorans SS3]
MKFIYASICETGSRSSNEDAIGVWRPSDDCLLAAVADGLGGMGGGHFASAIAIEFIDKTLAINANPSENLFGIAELIHSEIRKKQLYGDDFKAMATTLSAVYLGSEGLRGVHCGDTRVMVARGQGIKRLTKDHTDVARFYEQGKITKSEYRDYPRKNILYSALGGKKDPEIQKFCFSIESGDWILLTSDGVHGRISMTEFRDIANISGGPDEYVTSLRNLLDRKGVSDNFSAVVVHVVSE